MKILKINASANRTDSISRNEVNNVITRLLEKYQQAEIIDRDVAYNDLPYPTEAYTQAILHHGSLNPEQLKATQLSDRLVNELMMSDIIVIGSPMYNFGIPASLKAYFDLIARAGKTFAYSNEGFPVGLVKDKKAIVVITTGGVPLDSPMDFTKTYLTAILNFLGINAIEFIMLDENKFKFEEKKTLASEKLNAIFK